MRTTVELGPEEGRFLTVRQVAAMLHLGQRSVWKFATTGELPAPIRIGRSVRWDRSDIEVWIARKRVEAQRARGNLARTA